MRSELAPSTCSSSTTTTTTPPGRFGWRRRRVLRLGMPLIAALEPQERVALIGHELVTHRTATRPAGCSSAPRSAALPAGTRCSPPTTRPAWRARSILFYVEVGLLLQDSRRAEYLADALAARVAGSDAVVATHEKLLLTGSFEQVARQFAHPSNRGNEAAVFDAVRAHMDAVPARERERRRRVAMLEASTLGSTHPPTGHRIRLLEQRPVRSAKVTLTSGESDEIDRELSGLRASLGRRLMENQRSRLYQR